MFGLECLILYIIMSFCKGSTRPNYVNSGAAQNFRKVRNDSLKDVSGLKEVKKVKGRCFL